jgi:glyoxylase-like metal-dependent hydrolase (beta-lactamase superfamily II)
MRVYKINDYLISFYDGRPAPAPRPPETYNWADYGALDVGVSTYVIRRGDEALVYDTFPTTQEAKWVRDYLTEAGVRHFTLVNSHWHLDHVGGNAIYADVDRIATDKTIQRLAANKAAIEAGTEWGPPVIKPLVVPNIGIAADTVYYVKDIKVELRPVDIHSEDGLVMYLPRDRIFLAGDTLEDTVTFITEPENVVAQYNNMQQLKQWDINRIYPNHGNPDVISRGGYQTTLIDATLGYLRKVITRSHDPDYLQASLEDYVGDSVKNGWVSIWWAYHGPHKANLRKVSEALRNKPLPDLPQ